MPVSYWLKLSRARAHARPAEGHALRPAEGMPGSSTDPFIADERTASPREIPQFPSAPALAPQAAPADAAASHVPPPSAETAASYVPPPWAEAAASPAPPPWAEAAANPAATPPARTRAATARRVAFRQTPAETARGSQPLPPRSPPRTPSPTPRPLEPPRAPRGGPVAELMTHSAAEQWLARVHLGSCLGRGRCDADWHAMQGHALDTCACCTHPTTCAACVGIMRHCLMLHAACDGSVGDSTPWNTFWRMLGALG